MFDSMHFKRRTPHFSQEICMSTQQQSGLLWKAAAQLQTGFVWRRLSIVFVWLIILPIARGADMSLGSFSGLAYSGRAVNSLFGSSVDGGGDFNGDGKPDIIIGAQADDQAGADFGAAYVIFGGAGVTAINIASFAAGSVGFRILGHTGNSYLGFSVHFAGNFNGDIYSDIIVGSHRYSSNSKSQNGAAYVIFGKAGPYNDINIGSFSSGVAGLRIVGALNSDYLGYSVTSLGDFNGDGLADVAVGAAMADGVAGTDSGIVYVLYGRSSAIGGDVNANGFTATNNIGFKIEGAATFDFLGCSVSGAGDINGDGKLDLIIGAYNSNFGGANAGMAYVIYGRTTVADINLNGFTAGTVGFRVLGNSNQQVGFSVSGAGDFNDDGIADVVVGAPYTSIGYPYAGACFVIFGKSHLVETMSDIDTNSFFSSSTQGYRIYGEATNDKLGNAVSGVGDINGDGVTDIILGACMATRSGRANTGVTYVLFGGGHTPADIWLTTPSINWGYRIIGSLANEQSGYAVSGAGDFNQDGVGDLLVASMYALVGGNSNRGRVTLLSGIKTVPTSQPSSQPSRQPSTQPSVQPSSRPSGQPSSQPSQQPTAQPSCQPSAQPSAQPVGRPTSQPSNQPSRQPSTQPSTQPSRQPSGQPTGQPSRQPSRQPSSQPSSQPSGKPSSQPSAQPSRQPSGQPTARPSTQPSMQPTSHPTSQPSRQPSAQPSRQPSRQPTSQPSGQPSSQPSRQPSGQPSSQPSRQPSSQPSGQPSTQPSRQPSAQPSAQPSGQPSMQPSAQPSGQPTGQPSGQPSGQPTHQPSVQPSAAPSGQPSGQPSTQPSGQPTDKPTSQPSSQPSKQPSAQPSRQPSNQPTKPPSRQPSCQPSMQPSGQPSSRPSVQPTMQPSARPTSQPSVSPTAQPSTQPSSDPTGQPSQQPSAQPSGQPTSQPSAAPTQQPTSKPSAAPSAQPSSQPSRQPTSQPTRSPSGQPSSHPSSQPTAQPSGRPSTQPSIQPSSQPSTSPTAWYNATLELMHPPPAPSILSIQVNRVDRTAIALTIFSEGKRNVMIYCAAFASLTYQPLSTFEILSQNTFVNSKNGFAFLTISNLYSATDYSIYCMSVTPRGMELSLTNALQQVARVRTLCCKSITVSLLASSVYERKSIGDSVSITINGPPSTALSVSVAFVSTTNTPARIATTTYPNHIALTPTTNIKAPRLLRIVAGTQDTVQLVVTLSGASAGEYLLEYAEERRAVNILPLILEPTLPELLVARFRDDGSAVAVTFDSPTDKAGYSNAFSCLSLLSFDGVETASCQWASSATVLVYPKYTGPGSNALSIGSNVTLAADQVRARCVVNDTSACSGWATVPITRLAVRAPLNPTTPVVSFPLPSAVSACNPLVIDLTASSGTAGRPWSSVTFKVLTSNGESVAATILQQYLSANYTYSPPTVVPTDIMVPGFIYSIQATLCNFLGACSTVVRKVTVYQGDVLVPIGSINGPRQRDTHRFGSLILNSAAYTESCEGVVSYRNLTNSWTVLAVAANGSTSATSIQSISQDSSVFKLAPFALAVGALYEVVLTATSTISGVGSSSSAMITVLPGELVASISQGSAALVQAGTSVSLDASGSYDQDVALLTGGDAGLSFAWVCEILEPFFNPDCSSTATSGLSAQGTINTVTLKSSAAVSSVLRFIVVVSTADASRSSQTFIDVTVTSAPQADLRISNTAASITSVDASSALTLRGLVKVSVPCTATWTVDDPFVNLAAAARTPMIKSISASSGLSMVPFNLVIGEGTLAERASFAFSLQCGDSSSTVTVTTNGAPLPGVFIISPMAGVELSTLFTFTAVQWSDPDLPLTYQFSYASSTTATGLALGSATEKSYAASTLPSGALNCTMAVYDSFSAAAVEFHNVTVTPVAAEDKSAALSTLLRSITGSVDDTKRVLSVASAALSQSNCSVAAPNCTVTLSTDDRGFRSTLLETLESLTAREDVNKLSVLDWSGSLQSLTANSQELSDVDVNRMIHIANHTIQSALTVGSTNYNGLVGVLRAIDAAVSTRKSSHLLNATVTDSFEPEFIEANSSSLSRFNRNGTDVAHANSSALLVSTNMSSTAVTLMSIANTFADVVTNAQAFGENTTEFLYDNFRLSAGLYELSADAASLTLQSPLSEMDRLLGKRASTATLKPTTTSTGAESIVAVKVVDMPPENYPADTGVFLSNPLYLQVTAKNGQAPLDMVSELEFTFQHLQSVVEFDTHFGVNFTSTCVGLSHTESYTFVCPETGEVLKNTCSNGLGDYVMFCPKLTPSCAQLGLYSAEVDILNTCKVTDYSSMHTTCRCSVSPGADSPARLPHPSRRRLAPGNFENKAMDETGATNMLITSNYVAMEFADTFNAAGSFNDPAKVVVVIYMFATLWGAGLLLLSACLTKGYVSKQEKLKQMNNKVAVATATLQGSSPSSASEVAKAKRLLQEYIGGVFPSVYDDTKSSFGRMLGELRAHHRYLSVFMLSDGQISLQSKLLVIGKILTVETMQMFILATLYDLQEPENDGSCGQFASADTCQARKSLFDYAQSYCQWSDDPSVGQDHCLYNPPGFSIKISLYILVLTSIFSSLFATPLDYLFKVCNAPLLEKVVLAQVLQKKIGAPSSVASGVRRLSAISVDAVKAAQRTSTATRFALQKKVRRITDLLTSANLSERVIANRTISEDVEHLHLQAMSMLPSVSTSSDTLLRQKQAAALHMKNRAFSKRNITNEPDSEYSQTIRSHSEHSDRCQEEVRPPSIANMGTSKKAKDSPAARAAEVELCEEIIAQRELMPKDSPYTAEFDAQWGIRTLTRPSSTFRGEVAVGSYTATYIISDEARADIYDAIVTSDEQAAELNENMPRYTLQHGGLAVLNLFVLDLLGRTTSAAKIFRNKFEEDFEKTKPVSRWYKLFAVAIILGGNAFFIYYCLLKALQKGTAWQHKYVQGCVVQFAIEMFLNETIECIWLNFVVPDLVRKEVKKATIVINKVVEQITESANARSGRSILFLDATPFLFSSTKVARAHPSLLESIVVLNYQSHLPGELSKTWPRCIQVATDSQRYIDGLANEGKSVWERVYSAVPVAILTVSTFLVLTLKAMGAFSFSVQRVLIRIFQPMLLSGLTLMWFFAPSSTTGLFLVITGSCVVLGAFAWRQYYVHKLERAQKNSTAPGVDDASLFIDLDAEMEDIESVPNSPKRGLSRENSLLSLHKVSSSGNLKDTTAPNTPVVPLRPKRHSIYDETSSDESTVSDASDQLMAVGKTLVDGTNGHSIDVGVAMALPQQKKPPTDDSKSSVSNYSLEILDIEAESHDRVSYQGHTSANKDHQMESAVDARRGYELEGMSREETKDAQADIFSKATAEDPYSKRARIFSVDYSVSDISGDDLPWPPKERATPEEPVGKNFDSSVTNLTETKRKEYSSNARAKAFSIDYSVSDEEESLARKADATITAAVVDNSVPVVPAPSKPADKSMGEEKATEGPSNLRVQALSVDYSLSDISEDDSPTQAKKRATVAAATAAPAKPRVAPPTVKQPTPTKSSNRGNAVESAIGSEDSFSSFDSDDSPSNGKLAHVVVARPGEQGPLQTQTQPTPQPRDDSAPQLITPATQSQQQDIKVSPQRAIADYESLSDSISSESSDDED